jgi:hypothetical protein
MAKPAGEAATYTILRDQRDRLRAARCYFRTLRNIAGWIDAVHASQQRVRDVVDDELRNTEELLALWRSTPVQFMAVSGIGETWTMYGENFGELLLRKIALMKKHRNDIPRIDPDFIWRMGPECPVPPSEYLRY